MVFTVDTSEISRMSQALAGMMGQFEWITARAMTTAAKASRDQIRREIFPAIQGGPAPWTRRGLIVRYASRNDLTAMAGFQYGEGRWSDSEFTPKGSGIPAGRYMGVNARGGDRRPKATERALRRVGAIRSDQFITPNFRTGPFRPNAQGNLPAGQYQQLLSRLDALPQGSDQTAGPKARRALDYFVLRTQGGTPSRWQLGAEPTSIVARAGRGPKGGTGKGTGKRGRPQTVGYRRGFRRAFNIVEQPNYERRFPIEAVAMREFQQSFTSAWESGFEYELNHPKRRKQ